MSYIVLARKYRPQNFSEVYAQDHVTKILMNALENNRIAHAYLFTGPRGVGKTSMARILAKSLNCNVGKNGHPCNTCSTCEEITNGTSPDVVEIDGASNTGVDDVRELQKDLLYTTNSGKYKIYIIDEVHMLSKSAFNALLKTLEEPPENVIFIFATTEPNKVIPTIISRCQRFDFKRIPIEAIVKNLKHICKSEHISYEEEALFQIAKKADGGMRDALSLTDQVITTGSSIISESVVRDVFGILSYDVYEKILKAINQSSAPTIVKSLHSIIENGNDLQEIVNGFLDYLRLCLMAKYEVDTGEVSKVQHQNLVSFVKIFSDEDLLYIISILMKAKQDMKSSDNPLIILEIALIKLAKISDLVDIEKVVNPITPVVIQSDNTVNTPVNNQEILRVEPVKVEVSPQQSSVTTPKKENRILPNNNFSKPSKESNKKTDTQSHHINTHPTNSVDNNCNITPEFITNNMSKIQKNIMASKEVVLASMLNNVTIKHANNRSIVFTAHNQMCKNKLSKQKDRLANIINNLFGCNILVEIDLEQENMEKKSLISDNKSITIDEIKTESPDIYRLIKDTDSTIIDQRNKLPKLD